MSEKEKLTGKEKEIYHTAEAASAVQIAKHVLETAPVEEMEPEEREEFERMQSVVEAANFVEHPPRPPRGSKGAVWVDFLEAYMRTILYHHEELKAEIEATFKRARQLIN